MSGHFAIVAEGITDQIVLKNVLLGYFADGEEPFVNFVQPDNDATGRSGAKEPGGWTLVRKWFEERKFLGALQLNKYLIVHVDTDIVGEIGIAKGAQHSNPELVDAVIEWFRKLIGEEVWKDHGHRFLFAIGVDQMECWLLSLVFDKSQKAKQRKETGCLKAINHERLKQNKSPLSKGKDDDKDPVVYREISRGFKTREDVEKAAALNSGFRKFLDQLLAVKLVDGPS